jgi:hypothetical protein
MSILPESVDYTDKDFQSINRRLELLLQAVFPTWTDFERASFGNILKESFAFSMDVLTFYQDQQAKETRWGTAELRSSIISLARKIDYILGGAEAATVELTFTIANPVAGDLVIPSGTVVRTRGTTGVVRFQTLSDATILAGNTTSNAVNAENSTSFQSTFTADGEKDEEFTLPNTPFLEESESVVIASNPWTRVDNFLDSDPTDRHYIVLVDELDKAKLRTGDGVNGAFPVTGDLVVVDYKIGGGILGNVEAGTIKVIEGGPFTDSFGTTVAVSINNGNGNALAAQGGEARESVKEARFLAPLSLRATERTVARLDYEDQALQVSGVARALMLTINEWSGVNENYGKLFIVPDGGGVAGAPLLTSVFNTIDQSYPTTITFGWETLSAIYLDIDIVVTIYLAQGAVEDTVGAAILQAIRDFFNPLDADGLPNTQINFGHYAQDFGGGNPSVPYSDIGKIIDAISGVRRVGVTADGEGMTLNGVEDNVDLEVYEFPEGGNLQVINGATSSDIINEAI